MVAVDTPALEILTLLLASAIRSTVLALAAWVVLRGLKVKDVSARHAAWTAVLCGMLLMPFLTATIPPLRLPVLPGSDAPRLSGAVAARRFSSTAPGTGEGNTPNPEFPPPESSDWPSLALALYWAVAGVLLGRFCLGYFFTWRLARSARPLHRALPELLEQDHLAAARRPNAARGSLLLPSICESDAVSVPLTVGCVKPAIILPSVWLGWDQEKLRAVLAHEACHARRRHFLVKLLASLNKCFFWFHPLAWWMDRRLADLAEEASDDCALLARSDRYRYAEALVAFAAGLQRERGARLLWWQAPAMARGRRVSARVERILNPKGPLSAGLTRPALFLLVVLAALVIFPAAALRVTRQSVKPPALFQKATEPAVKMAPESVAGTWQAILDPYAVTLNFAMRRHQFTGRVTSSLAPTIGVPPANAALALGAPPRPPLPPPPPPPPPPPSGAIIEPHFEGDTLAFKVREPDGNLATYRLRLQGANDGLKEAELSVRFSSRFEFYPPATAVKTK